MIFKIKKNTKLNAYELASGEKLWTIRESFFSIEMKSIFWIYKHMQISAFFRLKPDIFLNHGAMSGEAYVEIRSWQQFNFVFRITYLRIRFSLEQCIEHFNIHCLKWYWFVTFLNWKINVWFFKKWTLPFLPCMESSVLLFTTSSAQIQFWLGKKISVVVI